MGPRMEKQPFWAMADEQQQLGKLGKVGGDGLCMDGFHEIMGLAHAHLVPMALNAAVALQLPDIVARAGHGPGLTVEEIVDELPRQSADAEDKVGRILRILVLNDVFAESRVTSESTGKAEVRFGLTALSRWLVTSNERNLVPMVRMKVRPEMVGSYAHLHSAVLDDHNPFELANGATLFENELYEFRALFADALACRAKTVNWVIAHHYPGFAHVKTLVDVGGCRGHALEQIVREHPHLRVVNFDLPEVIAQAPAIPGVRHEAGDMFDQIPRADAVLLEKVLHDWSDEKCLAILKNCHEATPKDGRLIIRDEVLRSTSDRGVLSRLAHAANLAMLAYTGEGKERTAPQWRDLLSAAGFQRVNFFNFSGLDLIEAFKA